MRSAEGYVPIEDYALLGDGRTAALVARDGAIDWLCLPNFDSPSILGAIVDARQGGTFELEPRIPFRSVRRYLTGTNVLETTFETDRGAVRVVDALTLPDDRFGPQREIVRQVQPLSGSVPMRWQLRPRFRYGGARAAYATRGQVPVASCGPDAIAVCSWFAGEPRWHGDRLEVEFEVAAPDRAVLAVAAAHGEPLVLPSLSAVERRLGKTIRFWEEWTAARGYDGPYSTAVLRSALVLKALIFAPSGASVAAPTTSLPETIGGERNWDYRYCWIRDSNFAIDALLNLGCYEEAESLFWWFMQATALTNPELHVLYRLDGGIGRPERSLPLDGYRHSRPVRVGNGAVEQVQHDIYGCLFETARLYSNGQRSLDADIGGDLARIADYVCTIWRQPDAGIWEVRNGRFHFTHSKAMCWVALDRAVRLAERGELPAGGRARWAREADAIRRYIDDACWSDRLRSYTRIAGEDDVDASLLMLPIVRFSAGDTARLSATIDAVDRRLRSGDFVFRYRAPDGLRGDEGCFLNCSFWMVSALARVGRIDEATALMERLLARANDVGLYAEEADPRSGAFLGNFPQALVHLALIDAAISIRDAAARGGGPQ
jgi:GH15 family glucan-1,4-alpha-glucosidase